MISVAVGDGPSTIMLIKTQHLFPTSSPHNSKKEGNTSTENHESYSDGHERDHEGVL